jgi:DNA-binding transcriptional LysR family regulator
MGDIETRLFRYFVALAEEQHFARAAERLGISPPTLTSAIQKLERELGARLARRKGNTGVALTETGRQFFTEAQRVLRQAEEATVIARQAARGEVGRIELGYMTGILLAGLLHTWIGEFERANPAIDIARRRMRSMAQIAGLTHKELDAGFTRTPHKYPEGLKGIEVYREPLLFALPGEHPLARRQDISPAMLRDEIFVDTTPELNVGFFGFTDVVAAIGNFTPRVSKCDNDFTTLLSHVGHGYGIAVVPQLMTTMNFPNVVFRDIAADPVPQASIAFVYRDDPSPAMKRLIKHMRRHALPPHGPGTRTQPRCVMIPTALHVDRYLEVPAKDAASKSALTDLDTKTCRNRASAISDAPRLWPFAARSSAEHLMVDGNESVKIAAV